MSPVESSLPRIAVTPLPPDYFPLLLLAHAAPTHQTTPMQPFEKILVPVDLSSFSAKAVAYAARLAGPGGAITLLTVVSDVLPYFDFFPIEYPSADYFEAMKAKAESELRALAEENAKEARADVVVRRGYPAAEIIEMAAEEKFDLIVMATHGHSGLEHALLGSITEKVLRKAHCPVLVAR